MKINLPKKIRIAAFVLAAIIFLLSGYNIYRGWKYPGSVEEKFTQYAYKQKFQIDYQVNFTPNMLYEQTSMEGRGPFVSKYVRNIDTLMNYQFEGERAATIEGEYEIIGLIQGLVKQGDKTKVVWAKKYPLSAKTPFSIQDKSLVVEKAVTLNFVEYNTFVNKFLEDTKLNTDVKMTVFWNISAHARTDKGVVNENLSQAIVFALGEGYFEIDGEPLKEKNGALEETVKKPAPLNKTKLIIFSFLGGLALLGLIFIVFFVNGYSPIADPYLKKKKQILKEHADRLVVLRGESPYAMNTLIELTTMEDLVRVADELSKPIMYRDETKGQRETSFYVNTEGEVYLYQLVDEQEAKVFNDTTSQPPFLKA